MSSPISIDKHGVLGVGFSLSRALASFSSIQNLNLHLFAELAVFQVSVACGILWLRNRACDVYASPIPLVLV